MSDNKKEAQLKATLVSIDNATNFLNGPMNFNPKKKGTVVYMNSKIDAVFENKKQ